MTDETYITWHKSTGRFGVDMGFMSKIKVTELYKQLQVKSISLDEAVALICNSDLDEIEKVVVAVNIGEWKQAHTPWTQKMKKYCKKMMSYETNHTK